MNVRDRLIFRPLVWLRTRTRSSELWLVAVAAALGGVAGATALALGSLAHLLQRLFYHIDVDARLSAIPALPPSALLVLPAGGLLLGVVTWAWTRWRPKPAVDPVEANALHGGRMSVRDSLFVSLQTVISNGFGASVGLEAAYAQLGGAWASVIGRWLNLRRSDMRTFVGAGAGAAIAAAFGAPFTGAFYAFEIVIGSYTVSNIAPVAAAALAGALVARTLHLTPYVIQTAAAQPLTPPDYVLYAGLGLICAVFGVAIMRLVATSDRWISRSPLPRWLRPAVGGLALTGLAFIAPQTLSAGHGALHVDLAAQLTIATLLFLIGTKALASILALGFGFRGGLFFASLFLGSLVGRLFAALLAFAGPDLAVDPVTAGLVGMGALAVAVVGGPFTMSFLVLETTGDFGVTAAALTASLFASLLVRETFGYSFSTWRLHLRGETIRSAHDVGWLRTLTAGRMMRKEPPTIAADATLDEYRRRFPLGSTRRAVALDAAGRYAGIVPAARVYDPPGDVQTVGQLAVRRDQALTPEMSIKDIMAAFDETQSDELAVLGEDGEVLGVLAEAYATRRYAEELEKARRDLTGGD